MYGYPRRAYREHAPRGTRSLFDPRRYGDVWAWYRHDERSLIAGGGFLVDQIFDKSGNNRHLTFFDNRHLGFWQPQTWHDRPGFVHQNSVYAGGSGQIAAGQARSLLIVFWPAQFVRNSQSYVFGLGSQAETNAFAVGYNASTNTHRVNVWTATNSVAAVSLDYQRPNVWLCTWSTANNVRFWQNGMQPFASWNPGALGLVGPRIVLGNGIGYGVGASSDSFDGFAFEAAIWASDVGQHAAVINRLLQIQYRTGRIYD